jgi:hypothetical protein
MVLHHQFNNFSQFKRYFKLREIILVQNKFFQLNFEIQRCESFFSINISLIFKNIKINDIFINSLEYLAKLNIEKIIKSQFYMNKS